MITKWKLKDTAKKKNDATNGTGTDERPNYVYGVASLQITQVVKYLRGRVVESIGIIASSTNCSSLI